MRIPYNLSWSFFNFLLLKMGDNSSMAFDKKVLEKYGITGATEVLYNPSYEVLFNEETKEGLTGFDVGQETELGAINVMTGVYTGRSPKDKFIVDDENSHDTVWWTSPEY